MQLFNKSDWSNSVGYSRNGLSFMLFTLGYYAPGKAVYHDVTFSGKGLILAYIGTEKSVLEQMHNYVER